MGHCGSFREMLVSVGQEAIVVRKEGSVGLLVNCGSFSQLWVIVGLLGKCGSVWVSVGQCGSVWVRRQ